MISLFTGGGKDDKKGWRRRGNQTPSDRCVIKIAFAAEYKVVMYTVTSCHGAAIVTSVCAIVTSDTMVACKATFLSVIIENIPA